MTESKRLSDCPKCLERRIRKKHPKHAHPQFGNRSKRHLNGNRYPAWITPLHEKYIGVNETKEEQVEWEEWGHWTRGCDTSSESETEEERGERIQREKTHRDKRWIRGWMYDIEETGIEPLSKTSSS